MSYQVLTLDLSDAASKKQIVQRGVSFNYLLALVVPAGADIQLAIGDGEAFPFVEGQSYEADPCEPETGGLYLTNAAQPGVQVKLYVATDAAVRMAQ